MSKGVVYVLGIAGIAMAAAAGLFLLAENDPAYRLGELAGLGRYGSHDALIASAAARHGVDP